MRSRSQPLARNGLRFPKKFGNGGIVKTTDSLIMGGVIVALVPLLLGPLGLGDKSLSDQKKKTSRLNIANKIELARLKSEADIAKTRIQSGLAAPVPYSIREGMIIENLPANTIIVDPAGVTALVSRDGILIDFARGAQ